MRHCSPQGRRQEGRQTPKGAACAPADTSLSSAAFACLFSRSDPTQSRCCALYQGCRCDSAARPPDTATARQTSPDWVSGLSDIPHTRHEKTKSCLHHYWEPDEAQPHLLERGWSKQPGSSACAAPYRPTPACSARLGGSQRARGQRFKRDAAAFCGEGRQAEGERIHLASYIVLRRGPSHCKILI